MSLAAELLKAFEPELESISLVPSDGGAFEVKINGELVYSKLQSGRHPAPGEVLKLVENFNH